MPVKMHGTGHSWDRLLEMLGTGSLLGQALVNSWDRPIDGTGPSVSLKWTVLSNRMKEACWELNDLGLK